MLKSFNQQKFNEQRIKFPFFVFEGYKYHYSNEGLEVEYVFNLSDRYSFRPTLKILKKPFFADEPLHGSLLDNIIFHIGMVELVSYWKCACSPKIIIKNHHLSPDQVRWWKKLYFNGLGEFFYLNGISADPASFVEIESASGEALESVRVPGLGGSMIPVGGGKDSIVTLELLGNEPGALPFILNPRGASLETVRTKGFSSERIIEAHRTIDPVLLDLNAKGFLNGHTPFSALLAFVSVLAAILSEKKYIVLSNESSANEPTVKGSEVNHQYSKSVEFETDFRSYLKTYVTPDIEYFSFLRPLNELQIARIFSGFPSYFRAFKSCNAGSKTDTWCGKCSKCLFTYIILSPFLGPETLSGIFGHNLLYDNTLRPLLDDLTGSTDTKPFDCTGTTKEINIALCRTIRNAGETDLPELLTYYKSTSLFSSFHSMTVEEELKVFDPHHFLPPSYEKVLKTALHD
jgi:UDP-N-acetyl-alpha-D-muramoyl-L-alanyl-L-glutamate epimerase